MENLMYKFQPKALTDHELVKYCGLWLVEEPLPIDAQKEILERLEARMDELEHAHDQIKKLTLEVQQLL
jgi:hypothetical protein